jgi:hypothetical protein
VIQRNRCYGYTPYEQDRSIYCAVGRPRVVGLEHEHGGEHAFCRLLAEWWADGSTDQRYESLTGTFAMCVCTGTTVTVLTDRMGSMPVYYGRSDDGQIASVGTNPEIVAFVAGRESASDLVSIAELLLRQVITFPYTTRSGMLQLEPGACESFSVHPSSVIHTTRVLWRPTEPSEQASVAECRARLEEAMRFAGTDICRGASRVAVTLSGGFDSRTVLCCIPEELRSCAITYTDHDNLEFRTAAKLARAAGVRHLPAVRSAEFYAELATREIALLGVEQMAGTAHGFCIADAGLRSEFDLLVGGFLCDTFLKGSCTPHTVKQLLMRKLGLSSILRNGGFARCGREHRRLRTTAIRPELLGAVEERERKRLAELQSIRPESAEEWHEFYPVNRSYGSGYLGANIRLYAMDELLLHRDIVAVACIASPLAKLSGALTRPVFTHLMGSLREILNTNTGLPAKAGFVRVKAREIADRWRKSSATGDKLSSTAQHPWFAEHAWVDIKQLQLHSPAWQRVRLKAAGADAGIDILHNVLREDPRSLLKGYCEQFDMTFNYAVVQLALHLEGTNNRLAKFGAVV